LWIRNIEFRNPSLNILRINIFWSVSRSERVYREIRIVRHRVQNVTDDSTKGAYARRPVLGSIALGSILGLAGCSTPALSDAGAPSSSGWTEPKEGQQKVMLLGTYHFAGSEGDMYSFEADILNKDTQRELNALTEQFVDWNPDCVAVEFPPSEQSTIDKAYSAFHVFVPIVAGAKGVAGRLDRWLR
jgi:hypothetical protein